jgi:cAMP-specific phosphodiesterase 4
VAEAFRLIHGKKDCNIFSDLPPQHYKVIRKRIIECVISTDMTLHTKQCTYLKIKMESYGIKQGDNVDKIMDGLDSVATFAIQQEFLNVLIHAADISNPTKPMTVYSVWIDKIMEEFWNQGDKEKSLSLPISFLCDRETTNIPRAQVGFIENIVSPLVKSVIEYFPGLMFLLQNLNDNATYLKKVIEEESKKQEEKRNN